jgi:glycosyltransferase involved in cell wall biosynthesis
MKVAVITPYFRTPLPWLERCHQSVLLQTHPCTQIFVADGEPLAVIDQWKAQHIVLQHGHGDFGDTPLAIGSLSAIGQGFDAIAYLDSDNWYHPEHIASLVALHQQVGAAVCAANRLFCRLDGSPLGECPFSDADQFH